MEAVETRVAVIAIIVREGTQVMALNDLLHQYGPYILGRLEGVTAKTVYAPAGSV